MKAANIKVKQTLEDLGLVIDVRILPDAVRTAALAAAALDCAVGQIANSLIFRDLDRDEAVLIMCAGDHRVDLGKVRQVAGFNLGKADAGFVRAQTGFAIGGVPPVAHATRSITLLDTSLQRFETIWAAAGTPESVFCMTPVQLQQMTNGRWYELVED